jgi:hypothetical protein
MKSIKKTFLILIIFISAVFLFPQKTFAGTVSNLVDNGINFTAKTAYYLTKYSIKAGRFIIQKTVKGVKAVSKGVFNGGKDAFNTTPKKTSKHVKNKKTETKEYIYTLPPAPKIQ